MIRVLYNLTYYQVVTQILLSFNSQQREWLQNENLNLTNKKGFGLVKVLQQVFQLLNSSNLLDEDESFNEPSTSAAAAKENNGNVNLEALELQVSDHIGRLNILLNRSNNIRLILYFRYKNCVCHF